MEYVPEGEQSSPFGGPLGANVEAASRPVWQEHAFGSLPLLATGQ